MPRLGGAVRWRVRTTPRRGVGPGPSGMRRFAVLNPLLPLLLVLVVLAGCRTSVEHLPSNHWSQEEDCCPPLVSGLEMEYLGVGGWLIRHGGSSLLTGPFFSNPGMLDAALGHIEADTALIDAFLPPVDDVTAILVGHGHYDHLMDVPYIARVHAPESRVYGSRTTVHTLRGDPDLDRDRLVDMEPHAGDVEGAGEWVHVEGGGIRFMALRSGHAPHYMDLNLYSGHHDEPLERLPDRATGWLEGQTFAFLIDLLDPDGEPIYRIHYQDAAAEPPHGFPPWLPDRRPVDLMIVCVPGAEEVNGYPEGIVGHLAPRTVLLGHWEDFFRPRTEGLRLSPGADLDAFIRRLERALPEGGGWFLPEPGTRIDASG